MWPFTWWSSKLELALAVTFALVSLYVSQFFFFGEVDLGVVFTGSRLSNSCDSESFCCFIEREWKSSGEVYHFFPTTSRKCCIERVSLKLIFLVICKKTIYFLTSNLIFLSRYVNGKGWQHFFKTYCIPEDLVPRILSPAYFHHYNARSLPIPSDGGASVSTSESSELSLLKQKTEKAKDNEGEQLVLGVGPVQNSFWRLSRLVPLEGVRKQLYRYRGKKVEPLETSTTDSVSMPSVNDITNTPQSLEIQEGSDGISLRPLPTMKTFPVKIKWVNL